MPWKPTLNGFIINPKHKAAAVPKDQQWMVGSIHDLRKTFGTRAASAVPMHVLKQFMGHQSITTTSDYYLAADEHQLDQVRQAFSTR